VRMNLRRLYAIDGAAMLAVGILLAGWGPMWIGLFGSLAPHDDLFRSSMFLRAYGSGLGAFGLAALGVWRSREPAVLRAACPYFFFAHSVLFGIAWSQQTAFWNTTAGAALTDLLVLFQAAYGYYWISSVRQPGFPYRQSIPELRSEWESRIREAGGQQERNRLARELHDSVKQQLYAIQTLLAAAQAQAGKTEDPVELARGATRSAIAEMNALLDQLRASPLETVGLVEALRRQCEALGHRTGATVNAVFGTLPAEGRLSPGTQTEIFRIAQEALANIARHARASSVSLQMGAAPPNHLLLTIHDDGQGFTSGAEAEGMGLRNMETRAAAMGAMLRVESTPGAGCTVTLRVQLQAPEVEEYCRHMRLAGGALAFSCALFGLSFGVHEAAYALPAALGAAGAIYHFIQYARWKQMARGAQA
jgi:signal transduction histidine kinase